MALLIKIILIGDGGVGKTSLRRRFMGQSIETNYIETIGADLAIKNLKIEVNANVIPIQYQIWDLSGQYIFSGIRPLYYKGISGAIIVYDLTNRSSFDNVLNWLEEIRRKSEKNPIPLIILGNKNDTRNSVNTVIDTAEGELLAKKVGTIYYESTIPYYETSAITGENVMPAFLKLADMILQKVNRKIIL